MVNQPSFHIDDKFRALVESTPDTILIADETSSIIFSNKNITKTFGYTPQEALYQPITLFIPDDYREEQKLDVLNLINKNNSKFYNSFVELPGLRKDGSVFPMEISLSYWGENGKVFIAVIVRDITQRKKAIEDLDKEHQFLKAILENAEDAIIGCDENGEINYYNQATCKLFGSDKVKDIPHSLGFGYQLFNLEGKSLNHLEETPLGRTLNGEVLKNEEFLLVNSLGEQYNIIANGRRITCKDNIIRGAVVVHHDVTTHRQNLSKLEEKNRQILDAYTKLKEAERKLRESNNLLESRVNTRTFELTKKNEELNSSNNALQRTNTDLDNFLYIASHDLKVPLINMEGLLKLLHHDTGDQNPEVTDLIDKLQISVDRMKKTMKAISEVAQVEKQLLQQPELINLDDLVAEISDSMAEQIKQENVRLIHQFSEANYIRFSYVNLKSILYNLITNAIKYKSTDRAPEIVITSHQLPGCITLSVKDNGLGIDLEKHGHKLFGMFSRLHNHVDGSGIGLYVIKRIIENSGGSINVKSQIGKGSEFIVCFMDQE